MRRNVFMAALMLSFIFIGAGRAAEMMVVEKGVSKAPIIVAEGAPAATTEAVKELAEYIRKISGARVRVITGNVDPMPESAIWVGLHPKLAEVMPEVKTDFQHPEEIFFACNGRHLLIAGRDRVFGQKQLEHGTANAVYTFLEKRLDVRWLWPGALGEDIIKRDTVTFEPFEYRFHPVIRQRHFWPRNPKDWHRPQRLLHYSYPFSCGHAFGDWWEKYGEQHPDWFAQQPNGTRTPPREGSTVKICISNPGVWKQWLDNAEEKLRADPSLTVVSATPNDGPWHCVCEKCRAWDPPNAPKIGRDISLTDRHVKFWNILARGLRERFPDREVYVGAMAYAAYLTPPVAEKLEKNIAIAQVAHFPLTDEANREETKKQWKEWADMSSVMVYRPNLWYWAGGVWGFPEVAMKKTIEDFRFLADSNCVGIIVDVIRNHWATQGPQYYIMAQMAYDPYQDGEAVMKDYYRRGFGPAAAEIEQYWTLMEEGREAVCSDPEFRRGSASRYKLPPIFARVYNDAFLGRADAILKQAEAKVTEGQDLYRRRVAYVRTGHTFTRLMVSTIPLMARVRESAGKDKQAVEQVAAVWQELEQLGKKGPPYSVGVNNVTNLIRGKAYMGGMQDYFGPPSEEFLKAAQQPAVKYHPAEWKLAFSDNFQRGQLGSNWKVLKGAWTVKDGALVTSGGTLLCTRKFPGLQRVTFEALATPSPGVSDLSPFIQAGVKGASSGYLVQFGGRNNTASVLQRAGRGLREDEKTLIEPGKVHAIVAEYDGQNLRLTVDGKVVLEYDDPQPFVGEEHQHIGFYVHEGNVTIRNLKVYTSVAVPQGGVRDEGAGFE